LSDVSPEPILGDARRNLYDGIELALAPIMAARTLIDRETPTRAKLMVTRERRDKV